MKIIFFLTSSLLLFTGCSHKIQVNILQPAEIDRAAKLKTITVYPFQNDSIGLSSKIEAALATKRVDNKNYFTIVSRNDLERIFKEQRLQDTGLLDEESVVEVGKILGAQAHISGQINTAEVIDKYYQEKRRRCLDQNCQEVVSYIDNCHSRVFFLSIQLNMVDIEKGDIIYSQTEHERKLWRTCNGLQLPSKSQGLDMLASNIAENFAKKLVPNYYSHDIILLDEPDIKYNNDEEEMLQNAIVYIDHKRYIKAEDILNQLLNSTEEKSYVAAYNLGVIQEIKGQLNAAIKFYTLADKLTIKPIKEIDSAMIRIKNSLKNKKILQKQMQR